MLRNLGQDLIARTVAVLSIATALVAIAIAVDLPRTGATHHPGITFESEGALLAHLGSLHRELISTAGVAAEAAGDPALRAYAAGLGERYTAAPPTTDDHARMGSEEAATRRLRSLEGLLPSEVDAVFGSDALALHEHTLDILAGLGSLALSDETAALVSDLSARHRADADQLRELMASAAGR
jgi:hypothetical protein